MNPNRRQVLSTTTKLIITGFFGAQASSVFADAAAAKESIMAYAGDAELQSGALKLTAPEIAENGNTVPISVAVDGPVSSDSYVESIMIVAEGNPQPGVATFHFSPASGQAKATTRMRLAKTQNVVAVAKLSDGTFLSDMRNVKVTIGGCGG